MMLFLPVPSFFMRQVHPVSLFNMAQSELISQCNSKHLALVRDADDLATRGVTTKRVAIFEDQAHAFAALPTDGELDATKQEATARKITTHTQAVTQMQVVMGIVGTVNDTRSVSYKMFGSAGLDSSSDGDLYVGLLRVVRVGRARLADYTQAGLTPALLDGLEVLNKEFLARIDDQTDAEYARGHAADGRILAANALYDELIALCAVGKALYATTDARKYDDYVVTDTPPPPAAPVPPVA
jgi:hypothetical protein